MKTTMKKNLLKKVLVLAVILAAMCAVMSLAAADEAVTDIVLTDVPELRIPEGCEEDVQISAVDTPELRIEEPTLLDRVLELKPKFNGSCECEKIDQNKYTLYDNNKSAKANKPAEEKNEKAKISVGVEVPFLSDSVSSSDIHGDLAWKNDYIDLKYEGDICKGSAEYSVGVGTGYNNENGEFKLGGFASGKAEFQGISGKVTAKTGVKGAELKGEADGAVGTYRAKGKAELGIKDGKFNAILGGDLEANAVEAHVKGDLDIGGIDIKAKASVKVGVGVNLKAGFEGTKFKCKIGAAVGIGADVEFSVDPANYIRTQVDNVKRVWNWVTGNDKPTENQAA